MFADIKMLYGILEPVDRRLLPDSIFAENKIQIAPLVKAGLFQQYYFIT